MNLRIRKIYAGLSKNGIDGLIVNSAANIAYLTNYTSRDSYLLISRKSNIYFTDSRYIEEARKGLRGVASVKKISGCAFKIIARTCSGFGLKRIGFEENYLACTEHRNMRRELNKKAELVPACGMVEKFREIKGAEEVEKIREAVRITTEAFRFIERFISCGRKEAEIAGELERFIRYNGAHSSAFDIIVASGPNSSLPHHLTSQRKLRENEHVLIDMGVEYKGYKSDLTRVFFLGKINPAVAKIYEIVGTASRNAINQIKPAVNKKKVDKAARQYITRKGYGGFFDHSLGHGIGLEVHEEPRISSGSEGDLMPGMVFTVEPAIYLPGRFGIRIEDMVLVTGKGNEVLSGALDK
ncbi:MAG: aminopeptidase P family protein [Candidatus Omnitrophota bacterium]